MAKPGPKGPSKYHPGLCAEIVAFFDIKPYREAEGGKEVPNDLPHLVDFAKKIGVSSGTISVWGDKYPEFSEALKAAKELNEKMLAVNALRGLYNSTFSIFMAKNKFGWRDEQHLKGEGFETKQIVQVYIPQLESTERPCLEAPRRATDQVSSE